jgi:hypothetical protein
VCSFLVAFLVRRTRNGGCETGGRSAFGPAPVHSSRFLVFSEELKTKLAF